jgi:hypothetical protein
MSSVDKLMWPPRIEGFYDFYRCGIAAAVETRRLFLDFKLLLLFKNDFVPFLFFSSNMMDSDEERAERLLHTSKMQ